MAFIWFLAGGLLIQKARAFTEELTKESKMFLRLTLVYFDLILIHLI